MDHLLSKEKFQKSKKLLKIDESEKFCLVLSGPFERKRKLKEIIENWIIKNNFLQKNR